MKNEGVSGIRFWLNHSYKRSKKIFDSAIFGAQVGALLSDFFRRGFTQIETGFTPQKCNML